MSTPTLPMPDLTQAQAEMRWAYWHGAFGVLASAMVWGLATGTAAPRPTRSAGSRRSARWA